VLKSIRSNKKIRNVIIGFVALLLAGYVLVGFGSAPAVAQGDTIAQLGSSRIKLSDVWIQLKRIKSIYAQFDTETVNNIAVNQLISDAILLDGAHQMGLAVSDSELRDFIIRSRTREEGTFISDEDWQLIIKNNYGVQVESFEEYHRSHSLLVAKYRSLFYDGAYVSEKAINEAFTKNSQKVKLEMLTINTFDVKDQVKLEKDADIEKLISENQDQFLSKEMRKMRFVNLKITSEDTIEVTDAEANAFYQENIARFQIKERVQASHILVKAEGRTDEEALALAQKVRTEIEAGLDFAEAAKMYSDDTSNKDRGGDLGSFGRGQMVKPFEDAAFTMADDSLSNPVKTTFGYHLIKKVKQFEASTRPLEEVKASVVTSVRREKSKEMAMNTIKAFHDQLADQDFLVAAEAAKLEVQETPFFDNDQRSFLGNTLKSNFQARDAAFKLEALNDYTEPLTLGQDVVVMQYIADAEPRNLTLVDDSQRVRQLAEAVAASAFIKSELAKIRAQAEKEPTKLLKDLTANRSWIKDNHFKTTTLVDANTVPYELRTPDMDFAKDIYAVDAGSFLPSVETSSDTRFALVRVTEKEAPDMSKLDEERVGIVSTLRSQAAADLISAYMFAKNSDFDPKGEIKATIAESLKRRR